MVSERAEQQGIHRLKLVHVLGYYGKANLGDDCFEQAITSLLPRCNINFKYPGRDKVKVQPDVLILGGGDVIKKRYLDEIGDRPYYILGAGLGYESELDLLGPNLKEAYFRNQEDVDRARLRGINALYCPDLAFALGAQPRYRYRDDELKKKRMAVILANSVVHPEMTIRQMTDVYYLDYLKWELAKALDTLVQWYDIDFLSMSDACYAYDQSLAMEVASRMKHGYKTRVHMMRRMGTLQDYDLAVTMKFHGMIFAILHGVPFVNIGLTRKMEVFCRDFGFTDFMLEPYSFTADRLFEVIKRPEADRVSERLLTLTQRNYNLWQEIKPKLASWLG